MDDLLHDAGYKITWDGIRMYVCDGYRARMTSYHMHSYYEISLLCEGNMSVFFSDECYDKSDGARVVLMKPFVPHFITTGGNVYYRHCNIEFSADFLSSMPSEFANLADVFGTLGTVLHIDKKTCDTLLEISQKIEKSDSITEKKLFLLEYLAVLGKNGANTDNKALPAYIVAAMRLIANRCKGKLTADEIAEKVGVGRTTLMTNFKKYTGSTVNEYIMRCRINHAVSAICANSSEEEAAASCGFGSVSNMIHSFRKICKTTPKKYIKEYL